MLTSFQEVPEFITTEHFTIHMAPLTTHLKSNLAAKILTVGSWLSLGNPAIAEIMANAGFEWLVVDLEHSAITLREAEDLIRVITLCRKAALVRLSCNDPVQAKRVMDAGATGIIIPMVNNSDQARQGVDAIHYPPHGSRGIGLARAQEYGAGFDAYREWLPDGGVVIVQVEHRDAVENLEGILSVNGVDGFIVGPYDLSGSFGVPGQFDHPLMLDAMDKIKKVGDASGKACGIHIVEPDILQLQKRVAEGYTFIAYGVDMRMIDKCSREGLESIKSL